MKQASSYGRKIENNMSREVTHLQIVEKKNIWKPMWQGLILPGTGEASPEVLCPAQGSLVRDKHGYTGGGRAVLAGLSSEELQR